MPTGSTAEGYQRDARGHRGTRAVRRLVEYAPASGGLALWMRPPRRRRAARERRRALRRARRGRLADRQRRHDDLVRAGVRGAIARGADRARRPPGAARRRSATCRASASSAAVLGDVDPELYNLCADAIVDAALSHLEWLALPPGAVSLDTVLERLLGESTGAGAALLRWDTESLYRAIDDREPSRGASTRADARAAPSGSGGEENDASAGGGDTSGDDAGRRQRARRGGTRRRPRRDRERGATRADGPDRQGRPRARRRARARPVPPARTTPPSARRARRANGPSDSPARTRPMPRSRSSASSSPTVRCREPRGSRCSGHGSPAPSPPIRRRRGPARREAGWPTAGARRTGGVCRGSRARARAVRHRACA